MLLLHTRDSSGGVSHSAQLAARRGERGPRQHARADERADGSAVATSLAATVHIASSDRVSPSVVVSVPIADAGADDQRAADAGALAQADDLAGTDADVRADLRANVVRAERGAVVPTDDGEAERGAFRSAELHAHGGAHVLEGALRGAELRPDDGRALVVRHKRAARRRRTAGSQRYTSSCTANRAAHARRAGQEEDGCDHPRASRPCWWRTGRAAPFVAGEHCRERHTFQPSLTLGGAALPLPPQHPLLGRECR